MKASLLLIGFFIQVFAFGQEEKYNLLIARNTGAKELANGETIKVFGFAENLGLQPGVPGPTITLNQGDSAIIDLWNVSQGAPHTIHLHGLDVNQANDGVPHLSFEVPHMEHGYYFFKATHPGTYLYHCHVASTIHVQAGMYGLIIVKPTDGSNNTWDNGYAYEQEHSFFLSEIDTVWHRDDVLLHDHKPNQPSQQIQIPQYHPQFFLVNGFSDQQLAENNVRIDALVNEVNYARLANIGFYGVRIIFPALLDARIIATDGRPIISEEISDTVIVMPGERYGVLHKASAEFEGNIRFEYFNLNTMEVKEVQLVPVSVDGTIGIADLKSDVSNWKLVPNPAKELTHIELNLTNQTLLEVVVRDIQGKKVLHFAPQLFESGSQSIPVSVESLTKGQYLVQVRSNKKVLKNLLLVK
ncbi:MAG: FtsP/CotA-like multicopper oxidase with cupredoxin domain [Flavobacteriales bacterium]|jgi:FtsP/CotA-like multicopper oxidase with cupredoxin domain